MAGGITPEAPGWPALYNPAIELEGFQNVGAIRPGGQYLHNANGEHFTFPSYDPRAFIQLTCYSCFELP